MTEAPGTLARVRQAVSQAADQVGPHLEGAEHIPSEGGAILAFNNVSPLEWLRTQVDGRRITFVAEDAAPAGLRSWLSRRGRGARWPQETDEFGDARRLLEAGELLGVFPEGPRSPDGDLYRGQPFTARLALAHPVPLVPAAVLVDRSALGRAVAPRIRIGAPLDIERFRGLAEHEWAVQAVTDLLMEAIAELSGQTYHDVPSGERRVALHEQRRRASAEVKEQAARRRAQEAARVEQRRADRAAEAAELAQARMLAAQAAADHARRAAEADRRRREQVRQVRMPAAPERAPRDLRAPVEHRPEAERD
ncbi:lysophospholipid acyltransferase family protein [Luteococcus peritonei]|uniref:Lysophospholipid acyltransferase family protein n=1 Tax=Luteococcus peritonei TaxID=88874 RepID=A0ABW4RSH5_9ACTN